MSASKQTILSHHVLRCDLVLFEGQTGSTEVESYVVLKWRTWFYNYVTSKMARKSSKVPRMSYPRRRAGSGNETDMYKITSNSPMFHYATHVAPSHKESVKCLGIALSNCRVISSMSSIAILVHCLLWSFYHHLASYVLFSNLLQPCTCHWPTFFWGTSTCMDFRFEGL